MPARSFLFGLTLLFPGILWAQDSAKFSRDADVLVYDTENLPEGAAREIEIEDVDHLKAQLRKGETRLLRLNSTGGSVWAGNEMARIVEDYGLDTEVHGECSSSCVTVFLGGNNRALTLGSKIGFHQRSWAPDGTQSYYERWREEEGWDTPFDFASWVYQDTQSETWKELTYMISRGVDAEFAIETKRTRSGIWFPSRRTLTEAGILRAPEVEEKPSSWLP